MLPMLLFRLLLVKLLALVLGYLLNALCGKTHPVKQLIILILALLPVVFWLVALVHMKLPLPLLLFHGMGQAATALLKFRVAIQLLTLV